MKDIEKFIENATKNLEILEGAEENMSKLASLSGQYDFETFKIVGQTIPARWCPELKRNIPQTDLPIVSVQKGGTGAINASSARINLGIGSMGTQDFDNVNITGGSISVDGQFNTGVVLNDQSYSTSKISIRSPLVDFRIKEITRIFTVPGGHFFLVDEMEIISLLVSSPREAPIVSFGNIISPSSYYGPETSASNQPNSRHTIERRQDAIGEGEVVVFSVEEASTADEHFGFGLVTGYLVSSS